MPVGFNSPARNLFLLGSSGAQVVTNFFKTIDQSAGSDQIYLPDEIKYNDVDQKFVLAGSASDSQVKGFGWLEKRQEDGTQDWGVRVESTQTGVNTKLRALHLTENNRLVVVGGVGDIPWIATYTNGGSLNWQATTNSANVEYTGVTSKLDSVTNLENYYACGITPSSGDAQAFVEKFDASGNPGWGKSAFMLGRDVVLEKIAANDRGEVVAVGLLQDDEAYKGYIVKIDTNTGEVLWDRTLRLYEDNVTFGYTPVFCEDVFIDSKDQIYIVGRYFDINESRGFIVKYTAEGNMIWQKETPVGENIEYYEVKSDGETEQTIVFGRYYDSVQNDWGGILSKYSKNGNLVWRRTLFSSYNNSDTFGEAGGRGICLDADPSFYYLLYFDDAIDALNGTPLAYTFGKVSSSGNGLGGFEYTEGTGETLYYDVLNVQDKIGRLSDGSVRNDTSDNLVYPFNGTKILFDDLATQVSNKKRQMDDAGSFEYSGSPAIRPPDFAEFSLGYSQSGRDWYDLSGNNRNAKTVISEPYLGWGSVTFDGTSDYLDVAAGSNWNFGTDDFTIECWVYPRSLATGGNWKRIWNMGPSLGNSYSLEAADDVDKFRFRYNDAILFSSSATVALNQWTHLAFVKSGGNTISLYINGTFDVSATQANSVDYSAYAFRVGANTNDPTNSSWNGYISNFRIVKGTALYTSNFTPPTEPLTRVAGTKLLTCQGDTIRDGGEDVLSITANGNAAVTADGATWNSSGWWELQSRSGATAPFPGTAIDLPRDYSPDLISSGFTASWWQRGTTTAGQAAQFVAVQGLMQIGNGDTQQSWRVERNNSAPNTIEFGINNNATGFTSELISNNFPDGEWIHVTIKWDGTTQYIYKNGALDTSAVFAGTPYHHPGGTVRIGSRQIGAPYAYNGDIAEFRLWDRPLAATQIFQDYNATKTKYIEEAPDTAPKITSDGIVIDSNLVLNYDFGNRATYDRVENLLPWSEDFTKWNQSVHFWENNYAIAPDGTKTAALLKESIPPQQQLSYFNIATMPNVTISSGDTLTFTVFAKANTHDVLEMHMYGDSQANFNLTTGVTTSNGASMSAVGDGWYFCKWTRTKSNTEGAMYLGFSGATYAGVGVDKSMFIWHPQVERGNSYGRYIKTSGLSINAPTTVKNLSSSSITGTLNGPVFAGNSFGFDGTNDRISLPGPINAYPFTVSAWVTHNASWDPALQTMDQILNMNIAGQRVSCGIVNVTSWPGRITLMYGGTSHWTTPKPATTGPGDWHQIVWTVVGSNNPAHAIYLDGVSQTMTDNGGGHGGSAGWSIGSNNTNSEYWNGSIGEIQIYDRVLSAAEVLQNYNATSAKYSV